MSQQINLINPDFRRKREFFTALMLARAMAVVLVAMAGLYAYNANEGRKLAKGVAMNAALLESEKLRLDAVVAKHAPRAKSEALEKRVAELEERLKGEQAVLDVLRGGSLGNTEGYSEYLRAFARQTVSGLWLTEFTITGAGMGMAIGGRTLRPDLVPQYIQRLNQEPITQGRAFAALEMQQAKAPPATADKPAQVPNYLEFKLYSTVAEDKPS